MNTDDQFAETAAHIARLDRERREKSVPLSPDAGDKGTDVGPKGRIDPCLEPELYRQRMSDVQLGLRGLSRAIYRLANHADENDCEAVVPTHYLWSILSVLSWVDNYDHSSPLDRIATLVEALEHLVGVLDMERDEWRDRIWRDAMDKARTALALAKGDEEWA